MMMLKNRNHILIVLIFLSSISVSNAQFSAKEKRGKTDQQNIQFNVVPWINKVKSRETKASLPFNKLTLPPRPLSTVNSLQHGSIENTIPNWIEGTFSNSSRSISQENKVNAVLWDMEKSWLPTGNSIKRSDKSLADSRIVYLVQEFKNIPVYGAEGRLRIIGQRLSLNHHFYPIKKLSNGDRPIIEKGRILESIAADSKPYKNIDPRIANLLPENNIKLVVLPNSTNSALARLCYVVHHTTNLHKHYEIIVDATTGEEISKINQICQAFHGHHLHHGHHPKPTASPEDFGSGQDLNGVTRSLGTWFTGNEHVLMDVDQPMFNASASNLPEEPVGAILTFDAKGGQLNDDLSIFYVTSTNKNNWSNQKAVSAHYNATRAYNYYRTVHNHNSINGVGGNVISIVDITDENKKEMDNAFWNGKAIFYGNGNTHFTNPLPASLDVAGHEMSHGVIQATADLRYEGESGALNESFADIFASLIDRDDWNIGEEVVNRSVFRSGALRSLADPHNGGQKLGDVGYQPKHYNERYTGKQDNGGVHINSGIPNHAYYLIAKKIGKNKAEKLYFDVLKNYLVRSSNFSDLRVALEKSAKANYGEGGELTAIQSAFDQVGISGNNTTNSQTDLEENPGSELLLVTKLDQSQTSIINTQGQFLLEDFISEKIRNKPSVTDDGSVVVYVAEDKLPKYVIIDWANNSIQARGNLSDTPGWKNIAISKDGARLAGILDNDKNEIYIINLDVPEGQNATVQKYELKNPTTSTDNVSTSDIQYADALIWDHAGEFVIFDCKNQINESNQGQNVSYWDIGFIRGWDIQDNTFGDGHIFKLFQNLPDNTSVGNPSLAKNKPYVLTFDYLAAQNDVRVMTANIETNEVVEVFQSEILGYPDFSIQDDVLTFDAQGQGGGELIGKVSLQDDALNTSSDPEGFIGDRQWAVWFATGDRALVDVIKINDQWVNVEIGPNPVEQFLTVSIEHKSTIPNMSVSVTDIQGRRYYQKNWKNLGRSAEIGIDTRGWPSAVYFLSLQSGSQVTTYKVFKK